MFPVVFRRFASGNVAAAIFRDNLILFHFSPANASDQHILMVLCRFSGIFKKERELPPLLFIMFKLPPAICHTAGGVII